MNNKIKIVLINYIEILKMSLNRNFVKIIILISLKERIDIE